MLRHELSVLRRQAGRPQFQPSDRLLLAAASRLLPRALGLVLVTPSTLPRWHRQLVACRWTYAGRRRDPRARAAPRAREPTLGLAADRGEIHGLA
jgi:putative transposase